MTRAALRPLTLCSCDCEILTTALRFGLMQQFTSGIYPTQRCLTTRHMTGHIFQIEAAAPLAQCSCMPRDCGVPLTDLRALTRVAITVGVFRILAKVGLPVFLQSVLRRNYNESNFAMAWGVRQGWFPFTMAFGPIFRWLNDIIISRDHSPAFSACTQLPAPTLMILRWRLLRSELSCGSLLQHSPPLT